MAHRLDAGDHARFAAFGFRLIAGFDYAVGENYQRVARSDRDFCAIVARRQTWRHDSERRAAFRQALNAAIGAAKHWRIVAGSHVGERAVRGIELGEERGGESQAIEAVRAGIAIERANEFVERPG